MRNVKVDVLQDEEEGESNNISDLINRLGVDDDEGGPSGTPPPSIPSHTLNNSGLELNLQSGDIAAMTINTGGGFVDLDSEITAYNAVQARPICYLSIYEIRAWNS